MCKNAAKWIFKLEQPVTWNCGRTLDGDWAYEDKTGKRRVEITRNGDITVLPHYAWDGCTPKYCILDIQFGVPDGVVDSRDGRQKTFFASLFHDVLYQFMGEQDFPFTRHEIDGFFLTLMSRTGFRWRYVYFGAVWLFGGVAKWAAEFKRQRRGKRVPFGTPNVIEEPYAVKPLDNSAESMTPVGMSTTG